jgi:hypothetical protein
VKTHRSKFSKSQVHPGQAAFCSSVGAWAAVAVLASCVFFNQGVFYHPPGVFYTMGCYKMPKIISKIKSYATRPPWKNFAGHPPPASPEP